MIQIEGADELGPTERFGLSVLMDCSRLVKVAGPDSVRIEVTQHRDREHDLYAPGFETQSGTVFLPQAILSSVARIASATAEQESEGHDRHERIPSTVNTLVANGEERTPVVSCVARRFADAVVRAAHGPVWFVAPWPDGKRWAVALSHDLDVVSWWPLFTGWRMVQLARRLRFTDLVRTIGAAGLAIGGNPVDRAVNSLLAIERDHGVRSTWFLLAGDPSWRSFRTGDITYRLTGDRAAGIARRVAIAGHELGLHGSFATAGGAEDEFIRQTHVLTDVTGRRPHGVRQHFLRYRPPVTWQGMAKAGFHYDASAGFADRNGFRLGLADPVRAWDARQNTPIGLDLVPLIWMDRALSKYQGVENPRSLVEDGLQLAATCRDVEGLWTGLWHPNTTTALGYPGSLAAYRDMVEALMTSDPYTAPLETIRSWRKARRSVHARWQGDEAALFADDTWPGDLVIEDQHGDAIRQVPWPRPVAGNPPYRT